MKTALHFLSLISILLFLTCSKDPQLVFPVSPEICTITGFVRPLGCGAKVYLSDAAIIDSCPINGPTGYFAFDSVPFGSYLLTVSAPNYGKSKTVLYLDSKTEALGTITLTRLPSQINTTNPPDSGAIDSAFAAVNLYDTAGVSMVVMTVYFKDRMDSQSFYSNFSVLPPLPYQVHISSANTVSYGYALQIRIPADSVFSHTKITLKFETGFHSIYGDSLDYAFPLTVFPDTSYSRRLRINRIIRTTFPIDRDHSVDPNNPVSITFKNPMDQASVEKAFSITPSAAVNFFWSAGFYNNEQLLSVRFGNPLLAGTLYQVKLDSGYTTLDYSITGDAMAFSFTTVSVSLTSYYPLNGNQKVPVDTPFYFSANFLYDTASFAKAFSITPPVDSIRFSFSGSRVTISHASLTPDTAYTIVIDSSLKSGNGILFNQRKTIRFVAAPRTSAETIIIISVPAAHAENVSPLPVISLKFSTAVNRASVEKRFKIVPDFLYTLQWNDLTDAELTVTPRQYLATRTLYSLSIDSGYQSRNLTPQAAFATQFTTQPVRLESCSPVNNQISVPAAGVFLFSFNTPIDTSKFVKHLLLTPAVDSLRIDTAVMTDASLSSYTMHHAALSAHTKYSIILDSTITDMYGILSGNRYNISFTTE